MQPVSADGTECLPRRALKIAREAATSVADLLEGLPPAALEDAVATNRPAMIDRSLHWDPHLEEIRRALA